MIEFCLEDGERLLFFSKTEEQPTITQSAARNPSTAKTVNLPFSAPASPLEKTKTESETPIFSATKKLETKVKTKSFEVLEVAPLVISLLHNWVQWLYVSNQSYSSIADFLISPNFLVWILLLLIGAVLGFLAVKFCQRKGFAYVSLVVLAINLLLMIVPKR